MKALEKKAERVAGEFVDKGMELEIETYEPKKEQRENPPNHKSR